MTSLLIFIAGSAIGAVIAAFLMAAKNNNAYWDGWSAGHSAGHTAALSQKTRKDK